MKKVIAIGIILFLIAAGFILFYQKAVATNFAITDNTDDGVENQGNTWQDDDVSRHIGRASTGGKFPTVFDQQGGWRFDGVNIDQGVNIVSATLSIKTTGLDNSPDMDIFGNDADDAAAFSGEIPSAMTKTSASTNWLPVGNTTKEVIIITAIVQEIVDRSGWASGNAMKFITEDNVQTGETASVRAFFRDSSEAEAAELDIILDTNVGIKIKADTVKIKSETIKVK